MEGMKLLDHYEAACKVRRQTLNRCLVQLARGVDASLQNELLAAVSGASSSNEQKKNWIIPSRSGVRPLDFRDYIEVRQPSC
jgi:hypothetical protein